MGQNNRFPFVTPLYFGTAFWMITFRAGFEITVYERLLLLTQQPPQPPHSFCVLLFYILLSRMREGMSRWSDNGDRMRENQDRRESIRQHQPTDRAELPGDCCPCLHFIFGDLDEAAMRGSVAMGTEF